MEQKHKVILIADDDVEDQEWFEEAILDLDPLVRVDKVSDGRSVMTYLEKCTVSKMPCAIVLDYSMPFLNGAEVLAILCKDSRFESIPKFVWSTSNATTHINECLEHGATNYFIKPNSPNKLYDLVKEILDSCIN